MAINFSDSTPAAPSGKTNVAWQKDGAGNISGNVPTAVTHVYNEVVSGSGTAWTLAGTPTAGTQRIYARGLRLIASGDYTITGAAVTTVASFAAGDLVADYDQ